MFILVGIFTLDNNVFAVEEQNTTESIELKVVEESELVDSDHKTAEIFATKIVCDNEKDLPNWGAQEEKITQKTAFDFLSKNENCREVPWVFEWAVGAQKNPGDNIFSGEEGWTSFKKEVKIPAEQETRIAVREKMQDGYIPFYGPALMKDPVSAEFYCNNDVSNFDNYEIIHSIIPDSTYYCIGFNVPTSGTVVPIDGGWSEWSQKDNSCGVSGEQTRTCTNPIPSNGGLDCTGPNTQIYTNDACIIPTIQQCDIISDDTNILENGNSAVETWKSSKWVQSIPSSDALWIWNAYYVTADSARNGENETFTKTFYISEDITSANIKIAVDNVYRLEINEQEVINRMDEEYKFTNFESLTTIDIQSYLMPGINTIKFYVRNYASSFDNPMINPAGLIYHLDLESDSCSTIGEVPNVAPVAQAGSDQTITLSTDSVTLDGSDSTDSDGTIISYEWIMISGPSVVGPFDTVSPYIDDLIEGTYIFSLTITDNDGASSSDTVSVTVEPKPKRSSSGSYINRSTSSINEGSVLGVTTSCAPYLYTYIMYGVDNDESEVMKLQQFLNEYLGYNLPIDGFYGLDTYNAVKVFQLKHSQEVLSPWVGITLQNASKGTGFMYKTTQRWINMIKCPDLNLPMPMLP